jgi:acetyl/propionyl-CoA carboxylase alpha subunit
VRAAKAVNYVNAGTVEFIADASEGLRGDRIWFMEMNTRLQVEHPVTEEITGQDLVEWQLRVASGEKLPLQQEELKINGHAIEARLYAENPEAGFLPSTGKVESFSSYLRAARVDSAVESGDEISAHYDPMIAKVIMYGANRADALSKLREEWANLFIWPIKTNAGFIGRCLADPRFIEGDLDTGLIASRGEALTAVPPPPSDVVFNAAITMEGDFAADRRWPTPDLLVVSPWSELRGFRLNAPATAIVRLRCRGESYAVELDDRPLTRRGFIRPGGAVLLFDCGEAYEFTLDTGEAEGGELTAGDGAILSPMPGKIVSVAAKAGAKLKKGDPILVLEAMKMEHTLTAPFDGKLAELNAKAGAQVSEGVVLAKLEKD